MATMFVLVGLPGAGKTTAAVRLAAEHGALRLTPDEWLIPLFGKANEPASRDTMEGRLVTVALEVLQLGVSAVVDFGCWSREERAALHWLTEQVSADFELVYLPVDAPTQARRIAQRWAEAPGRTYPVSETELAVAREAFEVPSTDEVAGRMAVLVPDGWPSWLEWTQDRWPSITLPVPPARRLPAL